MTVEAWPLQWPQGWPRTDRWRRQHAQFNTGFAKARDALMSEIRRMGGRYVVLSSNIALRQDGLPYANTREPDDPGVAVYFVYKDRQLCFACDRWRKVRDNVQAIRKTVEAIRGIERWAASDMMERAFTGFDALPHLGPGGWREVLELHKADVTAEDVERAYRRLARKHHPDHGGDPQKMTELNAARVQAREAVGLL